MDDLTIAYIAIGAHDALRLHSGCLPSDACVRYEGQSGIIAAILSHAGMVDAIHDYEGGVFVYDIAKPFGERMAQHIITGGGNDEGAALLILCDLLKENSHD